MESKQMEQEGAMIDKSCLNFDGDEDCNKCTKHGYLIYGCPYDCPDYRGFFDDKQAVKEESNGRT